jgi:hypothetical protein
MLRVIAMVMDFVVVTAGCSIAEDGVVARGFSNDGGG